jgi:hypothetical protein
MAKKRKSKVKKVPPKKTASKGTSGRKSTSKKAKVPKAIPLESRSMVAEVTPADPVGACFWVDTIGQNHCEVTTQTLCKQRPGSTFRANKQCPD